MSLYFLDHGDTLDERQINYVRATFDRKTEWNIMYYQKDVHRGPNDIVVPCICGTYIYVNDTYSIQKVLRECPTCVGRRKLVQNFKARYKRGRLLG